MLNILTCQHYQLIILKRQMEAKQSSRVGNNLNYLAGQARASPKKNKMLMGVTFSKKASIKTLNASNTKDSHALNYRCSAHSIEHLHHSNSVENVQIERRSITKQEDGDQMFGRSYAKIQRMKGAFLNHNIDTELNDILLLIKSEKLRVRERMRRLERDNNYFRRLCEGKIERSQAGVNTQDFISDGMEAELVEKQVQCDQAQLQQPKESEQKVKKRKDAYGKLRTMLTEMNINPAQILPQEIQQVKQQPTRPFKALSDTEIIKIQRFFIKKLALKMQK